MTAPSRLTQLTLAQLPFAPASPYDTGFAALAAATGLALAILLVRRQSGRRRPLGWPAELLLITTVLSAAIAIGHELLTDDLCHGACL